LAPFGAGFMGDPTGTCSPRTATEPEIPAGARPLRHLPRLILDGNSPRCRPRADAASRASVSSGRVAGKYCYFPAPTELDVRVAPHPAQVFTNAPHGTRPLLSVVLARESADGSWHATIPCCPLCPIRLGCAKCDGGSDSLPQLSVAVDRRSHIVLLVSSRDIRSDCDLPASGSVANPTVLPGTVPTVDRKE